MAHGLVKDEFFCGLFVGVQTCRSFFAVFLFGSVYCLVL